MLLNPLANALAVIDAVVRVFQRESQLQALLEFSMVHETAEKLRRRVTQEIDRAESSENIFIATAEDAGRSRTGCNPGSLVAVRHHRLGLAESGGVATEHGNDVIGGDGALYQSGGLRLIRAIVVENFFHQELFPALLYQDATTLIDLADGQLNAFSLILAWFCFPAGDRQHDADGDFVGAGLLCFRASWQHKSQGSEKKQTNGTGIPLPQIALKAVCHGQASWEFVASERTRIRAPCRYATAWECSTNRPNLSTLPALDQEL